MNSDCPFCRILSSDVSKRIVRENDLVMAIRDGFPISEGHTLIIPKRHVGSFFDTTKAEREALLSYLEEQKQVLDKTYQPGAYNIGINDGATAGQTVPHLHIHLIPRYEGDVAEPRGGIRWIIPDKAKYWSD